MFQIIVAAALAAAQPSEPRADASSAMALAESRGLRLYQGYRIATNVVAKPEAILKDRAGETKAYVITVSANEQRLTFVGRSDEGTPYAIWRGRYSDGIQVEGAPIARASASAGLGADETRAFWAERAALDYVFSNQKKLGPMSCAGDIMPNIIVLPPTNADPTLAVYIMSPQTNKDVVSLGGHYRFVIAASSRVQSFRGLTEGCHDIDLLHDGQRLVADYVSHRSEQYPNEAHVFASLATDAKIMVDTGQRPLWMVEKGKIQKDDTPPTR
jgi:hypothetical protein